MLGGKLRIPHEASTLRRHAETLASSLWITRVCLFGSLRWTCVRRRLTRGERKQFLGHARGSLYEVETQLLMARRVGYSLPQDVFALVSEVKRYLDGYLGYVLRH